ncbi:MAG: DUF1559 domain-containing protein [Armatimonadia bacterium]
MRRGFTLIELLVVIAIIAILAAILFPVFAKAREKARQSSCLSNVKQLALAALSYAQDYDEMFPGIFQQAWSGNPSYLMWEDCILPYVKNSQIFKCPSHVDVVLGSNQPTTFGVLWGSLGYGWNGGTFNASPFYSDGIGNGMFIGTPPWVGLGAIPAPAETLLLGDLMPGQTGVIVWFVNEPSWYASVHNGGGSYAFVDGHAKWLSASTLAGKPGLFTIAAGD